MRQRGALEQHRIGGVGAGAAGAADQILQKIEDISRVVVHHTTKTVAALAAHFQIGLPVPGSP